MAPLSSQGPFEKVPDWLRWRSRASPDIPALKFGASVRWTWRDLDEQSDTASANLVSRGVKKGDRVALLMSPSEHYVALVHALARIGAVAVPLNPNQSEQEIQSQLSDSEPRLVIRDKSLHLQGERARIAEWTEPADFFHEPRHRDQTSVSPTRDINSVHAIIYTSGSTGAPKGVQLTLGNFMWNAISVSFRVGLSPTDRWLLALPLFHVGGYAIIFRSVLYGSQVVLHPKFEPKAVLRSMEDDEVTLASFVPTMLAQLLNSDRQNRARTLRAIFLGGDRPSPELVSKIAARRLPVLFTYGMTETCSQVAISPAAPDSTEPAYDALSPVQILVADEKESKLTSTAPGKVGEILVRGPSVFLGYWRKGKLTRARLRDGWFRTGDLGAWDDSGSRFTVIGRKDEAIITGGEKVLPAEVEVALKAHPAVEDVVVFGLDDPRWGKRVVAAVQTKEGTNPSPEEFRTFLKRELAGYKVPKQFHLLDALPRTDSGKARRDLIRRKISALGDASA